MSSSRIWDLFIKKIESLKIFDWRSAVTKANTVRLA